MAKNENRCWPGYEPVPGKEQHEQGSCRKKAKSKSTKSEQDFQAKRDKQVSEYSKKTGHARRSAQSNLAKPGAKKRTATKQTARKRTATKRTATKRAAAKRSR